jgi:hypothetical protein
MADAIRQIGVSEVTYYRSAKLGLEAEAFAGHRLRLAASSAAASSLNSRVNFRLSMAHLWFHQNT